MSPEQAKQREIVRECLRKQITGRPGIPIGFRMNGTPICTEDEMEELDCNII